MNDKIFISHSSKDVDIVKSFVEDILILGLEIPSTRIFCSSVEGQGVKSGEYIPDRLKEEIKKSSIALLFISQNYKSSEVCLNELGASWVMLEKEKIIPLILPETNFSEIGFLNIGRLGIKISERSGILKLIQDCKEILNPSFNLEKIHDKIEKFIDNINSTSTKSQVLTEKEIPTEKEVPEEVDEWTECFKNNLYALDGIIRKAIPALNDGIHKIENIRLQNQILSDLSKEKFLQTFWYKQAKGDYYVEQLSKLPSGNWLISCFNWEINIKEMWVCMYSELQYEFILIQSEKQEQYSIDSDIGGKSYNVGVLKDGTIVSENERQNGYAVIGGETLDLYEHEVQPRHRDDESHWVFLVSDYHKAGYNADETIEYCEKLDSGEIEVNSKNIMQFLRSLKNHPTVTQCR
jgi:hypothetical protein